MLFPRETEYLENIFLKVRERPGLLRHNNVLKIHSVRPSGEKMKFPMHVHLKKKNLHLNAYFDVVPRIN